MEVYHHPRIKVNDKNARVLSNFTPTKIGALGKADITKGTKMSFVSDAFFKVMFLNSERIKYSCKLISCLIDVEYEYLLNHLELITEGLNRDNMNTKAEYGDYIADIDGNKICIEVNNNYKTDNYDNINERNYEYINRLYNAKGTNEIYK